MARKVPEANEKTEPVELEWQTAKFHLHTFAYRDPRSAFASGSGLPVVSPTTVLLGAVSSLFSIGEAEAATALLAVVHDCEVLVDAPNGVIFFRAFHQLRRYETMKWGDNPRYGMTKINQGTREYGLVDGCLTLYIGVPKKYSADIEKALINLRHLGTSDSLCSLVGAIEKCSKPHIDHFIYLPREEFATYIKENGIGLLENGVATVTLSRFKKDRHVHQTMAHWKIAGDQIDTELVPFIIPGYFEGTSRGKIYRKAKP